MIISSAMPGGTKVNAYAAATAGNQQASNDFMNSWNAANPTGYADERSFMVADSGAYWAHQDKRKAAYDTWLGQQGGTQSQPQTTSAQPAQIQTMSAQQQPAAATGSAGTTGAGMATAQNGIINQQYQATAAPNAQTAQATAQPAGTHNPVGNNVNADGTITNTAGYTAAQTGAAKNWDVTSEQTMNSQIQGIIAQNSPLMQMAEARSRERANEMGLVNSSMAVTAGQAALYDAAAPIAQNDANTFAKAAGYNADIANQFELQNTGWRNEAGQFNAGEQNKAGVANASNRTNTNISNNDIAARLELGHLDADVQREDIAMRKDLGELDARTRENIAKWGNAKDTEIAYLDANTRQNIASLDANTRVTISDMESRNRSLLQSNQSAQAIFTNMSAQIRAIDESKLEVNSKKYAIQRQQMLAQDALDTIGYVGQVPNLSAYYGGGYV